MKNFLPVIMIITAVALGYFYLRPQYYEILSLREERQRYDDVLDKSLELRQIREELARKLANFPQGDLENLEKMIPRELDIVQLILDLDNIALSHGIVMEDIKTSDTSETPVRRGAVSSDSSRPYKTLVLSFSFESPYRNILPFLEDLEESLRIMDVVSVKVSRSENRTTILNYDMTVNTYWLGN